MSDKIYPVEHILFVTTHTKPFGSTGNWEETWYWDIYTADLDGVGIIRCECKSDSRNVVIPWFKTKEIDLIEVAKNECKKKMQEMI